MPASSTSAAEHVPVVRSGWFYWVTKVVLTPIMSVYFRVTVEGVSHVPKQGGAIVASNHTSYFDWLFLPLVIRLRRLSFLAKRDYFTRPGVRGALQRFFFSETGQVPLDRVGGSASEAALQTAERLLHEGRLLGIFPEGTRSTDGHLHRGKTGVVRMAGRTGAPIIPCGIDGAYKVAPKGAKVPRPVRVTVRFGAPMPWSGEVFDTDDAVLLRKYTDELMDAIQALSGQDRAED
jgi:1-acyl-sn-glycerol-3-phosphate acyltransferase